MNTNIIKFIATAASMIIITSSAMANRDAFDTSYAVSITQTIENQSNKLLKELDRNSYDRHPSTAFNRRPQGCGFRPQLPLQFG